MTSIRRLMGLLIAVGCLQGGALLAQSAEIGHPALVGAEVGTNGRVSAAVVFDDGSGPALYIGGEFTSVNGTPANRVAKWDGQRWSAVGAGINGRVHAMTVFDDGDGPALYVGGHAEDPANRLAKWDGTRWTPLAGEIEGHAVFALAVFNDGTGPALYMAGNFTMAGGRPVGNIARWDGKGWSAVDRGTNWLIYALAVFDDGSGPALCAAGDFTTAGDVRAENVARWDGQRWSPLRTGPNGKVNAMTVFDDGNGPALYVGGFFGVAGDVVSQGITKWDGKNWSAVGGVQGVNGTVYAVAVVDHRQGPALYIGGDFLTFLNQPRASHVARWDGISWSALGSGIDARVRALAGFDDGSGPALFAGGEFTMAGDVGTNNIAKWDGNRWATVGAAGVSSR